MRKKRDINSYLSIVGERVFIERKRLKMNQIEFYRFIMDDNKSNNENIKKKMNAIENAKEKTIDFLFLDNFCRKCEVSADYLFGYDTDFKNYKDKFINDYTGLDENAIEMLHSWKKAVDVPVDTSKLSGLYDGEEGHKEMLAAIDKRAGKIYLTIINKLFEPIKNKKNEKYYGLSMLGALFKLCMGKIKNVSAKIIPDDNIENMYKYGNEWLKNNIEYAQLDSKGLIFLTDDNNILHAISVEETYKKDAKEELIRAIEKMVDEINLTNKENN